MHGKKYCIEWTVRHEINLVCYRDVAETTISIKKADLSMIWMPIWMPL